MGKRTGPGGGIRYGRWVLALLAPAALAQDGGGTVVASQHACADLQRMINERGRVTIEYRAGYDNYAGEGTNDFQTSCRGPDEAAETYRVVTKDEPQCDLRYLCTYRPPSPQ